MDDPVRGGSRHGIHVGDRDEVSITIPTLDWDEHVRQQERDEYAELVDYGLRQPYVRPERPGCTVIAISTT